MKKTIVILMLALTPAVFAAFENGMENAFSRAVAGTAEIYDDGVFGSGFRNPALLLNSEKWRTSLEYNTDYFGDLFSSWIFTLSKKINQSAFGLAVSDFSSKDEALPYGELSMVFSGAYQVSSSLKAGVNFDYFRATSDILSGSGFNASLGLVVTPIKKLDIGLVWDNALDLPLLWNNSRKEPMLKGMSVSAGYGLEFSRISFYLMAKYDSPYLVLSGFKVADGNVDLFSTGMVVKFMKMFYLTGGFSTTQKSFGMGLEHKGLLVFFSDNFKPVGNRKSFSLGIRI